MASKIDELEKLVAEQKQTIEELTGKAPKSIAKIVSGPEMVNKNQLYRIESMSGDQHAIVNYNSEVKIEGFKQAKKLEPGTTVLVQGGRIVGIIPDSLQLPKQVVKKSSLVTWEEIGGMKERLTLIRSSIEGPLKHQKLAEELGVKPIKGILLYGPPGCGKTLIAKAIASTVLGSKEVDQEAFTYVKGPELLSQWVGATEKRIREIFKAAREYNIESKKTSVIFIDEAEAILPRRGSIRSSDVDKTIVPMFLAEMDGFDKESPIVILATNRADQLDDAVIREGRIDIKLEIKRPTQVETEEILAIHFGKVKLHDKMETLVKLASALVFTNDTKKRVSGAMLQTLVQLSASNAMIRKVNNPKTDLGVTEKDIIESFQTINTEV